LVRKTIKFPCHCEEGQRPDVAIRIPGIRQDAIVPTER